MSNEKTIIELNGVKLEVDMRYARRVDTLRVGDKVKLLEKNTYGNDFKMHSAIVAGFEPFPSAPTIIVAYLETGYRTADIKFAYINAKDEEAKKWEIVPSIDNDLPISKAEVLDYMQKNINGKKEEIKDIERQMAYFEGQFGKYFTAEEQIAAERAAA